jgi:hypothetical protein
LLYILLSAFPIVTVLRVEASTVVEDAVNVKI